MKKLFKLGSSRGSGAAGVPESLKSDLYATDGPTGLRFLAEPSNPVVE